MLTIDKDKTFLHCDLFEEAVALTPNHLVTVNGDWYVLGEAIKDQDGWIVPLQLIDRPQGIGTIRTFVVNDDGELS